MLVLTRAHIIFVAIGSNSVGAYFDLRVRPRTTPLHCWHHTVTLLAAEIPVPTYSSTNEAIKKQSSLMTKCSPCSLIERHPQKLFNKKYLMPTHAHTDTHEPRNGPYSHS